MAGNKYLNEQGLGHLWERIKTYTSSTYLSLTGGNVTGPVNFGDSVYISDLNAGNLIVTGNAAFTNNIQANTINGVEVGSNPKFTDTGTVTSVAAAGTNGITISGSPITSAGTITIGLNLSNAINGLSEGTSPANRNDYAVVQFASGGTTTTSYHRRKLSNVFAALNSTDITTALGFTPYNSTNPNGYTSNTGTVTSVRVQANPPLQSSTSTAQSSSLNTTISFVNQNANVVLAGPSSGNAAAPTFRALVAADIPSLSKSKISDFPTSMTPTAHTHGNISNTGTITSTTVALGNGDNLLFADSSNSGKIERSSITIGAGTTKYLRQDGTWGTPAGTYSLPVATDSVRGGVKIGYSGSGKNYAVQLSNQKMYVYVPWTDTNTQVTNTLGTTTKFYVTGTSSASTNTGTQYFDTGVYVTTVAGELSALKYSVHDTSSTPVEKVRMEWNSTDSSLDFIFI